MACYMQNLFVFNFFIAVSLSFDKLDTFSVFQDAHDFLRSSLKFLNLQFQFDPRYTQKN